MPISSRTVREAILDPTPAHRSSTSTTDESYPNPKPNPKSGLLGALLLLVDEEVVEEVIEEKVEKEGGARDDVEIVEEAETKVTVCVVVLVSEIVDVIDDEVTSFPFSPSSKSTPSVDAGLASTVAAVLPRRSVIGKVVVAVGVIASQPPLLHTFVAPNAGASPILRSSHLASQYVVKLSIRLDAVPLK